jgi:hypothetical protein
MKAAAMVFASDLRDEGVGTVFDRLQVRGGLDGVELAAAYHHARDVYPHNPLNPVHFPDGGAVFFRPDPRCWEGLRLQPVRARMLDEFDPLAEALREGERRGMTVRAWTNTLHNFTLGEAHPDCVARNAFGNPLLTDLCPANPASRAYARAMSADLSRYGVEAIAAEAVCYLPFDHGYHHERCAYPLSETVRFLLALCFCEHCEAAARAAGADVGRTREFVRRELRPALAGEPGVLDEVPLERAAVAALADGEMAGFLAARERVVTTLVAEVTEAVQAAGPARLVFVDSYGATDDPDQVGPLVADRSWRFGVDPAAVARVCHGYSVIGYSRSLDRFRDDVEAYRRILPPEVPLSIVLSAVPPSCLEAADLPPKIALARGWGADWIEIYVYGLMRLSSLDWIRVALEEERGTP